MLLVYATLAWTSRPKIKLNFRDETRVLRWNGISWRTVRSFCSEDYGFDSAVLKSPAGNITMFIHPLRDDLFVSVSLNHTGTWDEEGLGLVFDQLKSDPDIGLIDVGAHLGTFTLTAALMGHKVVAVDPLVENVIRLCQSAQTNGLVDYVTVVFGALSNVRANVAIKRRRGNIGGTYVEETNSRRDKRKYPRHSIDAVLMDDLLPLIDFRKVFIKLDVETHEHFVLSGARRLFDKLDVRGVLMEWDFFRTSPLGDRIIDFFTRRNFVPLSVTWKDHLLNPRYRSSWPLNVFWRKKV